ncbi:MAG TPA: hypothetical protein VN962_27500 [Polyangia bacterium]|nr:hypothetical protein [Polyangia bacterium]
MPIHPLFRWLRLLGIVTLVGCSSSLVPSGQGGSGGGPATGGVPGTGGALATGGRRGSGGTPGTGGWPLDGSAPLDGGSAPRTCGNTVCTSGEYCCDPLCSTCAPVGALCTQGCQIGDAGFGGGACAGLKAQYLQALRAAQSCTVSPDKQCGATIHSWLPADPCNCDLIPVNDSTQANAIYQTWLSLGCQPETTCNVTCDGPLPAGVCVPTDGGTTGVCQEAAPHSG